MRAAMLLYLLSSFATAGAAAAPTWMGDSFDHLKGKSLLKITLPGSHNSGNYVGGLHAHPAAHKILEMMGSVVMVLLDSGERCD